MVLKRLKEAKKTKYTEADFTWDEQAMIAEYKAAVLDYMNGASMDDALAAIKAMLKSGGETLVKGKGPVREGKAATKRIIEAVYGTGMYIVAADGEAGGNLYYIGNSRADARKEYEKVAKDWREFGLGGGDTPVCLYKYQGPATVFDDIRGRWENGEKFSYMINIEELGLSLNDCTVLASEWGDI